MIGKVLGNRYKLVEDIGSGGMARVYLAEDLLEQPVVAVKVLYPQFSEDVGYVQRFNREARLAMELSSPHIVRVLNYGSDRDIHYLVMEFVEGQDLKSIIEERGRIPYREALSIAAQVAQALQHAYEHGVVHRDIKPQNLMILPDGTVKVLDFGIARARTLPSLTQSGFIGSPSYISPEQAMGEPVDVRSDLYSLGVVLYEMLTGKLPFDAQTPWSIISQHITADPPAISLPETECPRSVQALVKKVLAKNPDDRFATPQEFIRAIEAILAGRELLQVCSPQERRDRVHRLLLSSLYARAEEATQIGAWPRAVNLYNQILKIEPGYRDVAEKLRFAGRQARLNALYQAARQAMAAERWQEAIDELSEILSVDPDFRDAASLLTQATLALTEIQSREQVATLYQEGLQHFGAEEWEEAADCFAQVCQLDPDYKSARDFLQEARRQAKRRSSLLWRSAASLRRATERVSSKVAHWLGGGHTGK